MSIMEITRRKKDWVWMWEKKETKKRERKGNGDIKLGTD